MATVEDPQQVPAYNVLPPTPPNLPPDPLQHPLNLQQLPIQPLDPPPENLQNDKKIPQKVTTPDIL